MFCFSVEAPQKWLVDLTPHLQDVPVEMHSHDQDKAQNYPKRGVSICRKLTQTQFVAAWLFIDQANRLPDKINSFFGFPRNA